MAEPRARLGRTKGQQTFEKDLRLLLQAFGDDINPLAETVKLLDEITTEYIIECCHEAAASATYARRAKIKVDDFKFALRNDHTKLGRITELQAMQKFINMQRGLFDIQDDRVPGEARREVGAGAGRGGARVLGGRVAKGDKALHHRHHLQSQSGRGRGRGRGRAKGS